MDLEWHAATYAWWLKETGKLLSESNHYDVTKASGGYVVKYASAGGTEIESRHSEILAGPFDTLNQAKDIAEMMHRLELWRN